MPEYTQRQKDAVVALAAAVRDHGRGVTPSAFAMYFWPGKKFARGNGPWGLGPDASGRHGGRMLMKLRHLGLAQIESHDVYWTARLTHEGRKLLATLVADPIDPSPEHESEVPDV